MRDEMARERVQVARALGAVAVDRGRRRPCARCRRASAAPKMWYAAQTGASCRGVPSSQCQRPPKPQWRAAVAGAARRVAHGIDADDDERRPRRGGKLADRPARARAPRAGTPGCSASRGTRATTGRPRSEASVTRRPRSGRGARARGAGRVPAAHTAWPCRAGSAGAGGGGRRRARASSKRAARADAHERGAADDERASARVRNAAAHCQPVGRLREHDGPVDEHEDEQAERQHEGEDRAGEEVRVGGEHGLSSRQFPGTAPARRRLVAARASGRGRR